MDRHCSCQSPYQPFAGQVYLDHLHLTRQDYGMEEDIRALQLSLRPLSAPELEEHRGREAYLQDTNERWAKLRHARTVEKRAFTEWYQCQFPPAKANKGKENAHRQLSGGVLQYSQPKPRPRPLDLAIGDYRQQHSRGWRSGQRGYLEFEIADQRRRVGRMDLGGQLPYGKGAMLRTTFTIHIPDSTSHLFPGIQQMQEQSEAQKQQNETSACGQWVREHTNHVLLKARAGPETGRRRVAQEKREQQKVQLPAAKPGNLYPGPSRISGIPQPFHIVQDDNMEPSMISELALSAHLKSKIASQEAYRKYKEEKERKKEEEEEEEQRKASESVKQLLVSVNLALEQEVEPTQVEAAHIEGAEHEALRAQSQQPQKGPRYAYGTGLKCGENFWSKYDKNYPLPRHSDSIPCLPGLGSTPLQALTASPDHSIGADESARHVEIFQKEVPLDSSRTNDLRAAVEAIDKTSGELLESPKTAPSQDRPPLLEPSTVSVPRNKCVINVEGLSLITHIGPLVKVSRQDVPQPPISKAERTDVSCDLREDEDGVEDEVEVTSLENEDIQSEWEEVDYSLGGDGGNDVEHEFVDVVWTGSSSSSDVEWASEGVFDF